MSVIVIMEDVIRHVLTLPVVTTVHVILGILLIMINMDVLVRFEIGILHCMINCDYRYQ